MGPADHPEAAQKEDAHFDQSEEMAWKYLGTRERTASWTRRVEDAKADAASGTREGKERVAIFERGSWGRMLEGRKRWEAKQRQR